ncbi:hypothetical protein PCASD_20164 [Puccinia coronata f. sp. avenae]|uniref:Uncharacterized protein n=1 Tax=Puccinia coronata f. sp. avenae TaxID=200324 RepID=A0A2N5SCG2_9BASI|nr:hypothetical protein PCASD_20164 [Puccinia coronata f. sp. avenae]
MRNAASTDCAALRVLVTSLHVEPGVQRRSASAYHHAGSPVAIFHNQDGMRTGTRKAWTLLEPRHILGIQRKEERAYYYCFCERQPDKAENPSLEPVDMNGKTTNPA